MSDNDKDFDRIHKTIVQELKQHIEVEYRKGAQRYIKEGIILYGVRLNVVRRISASHFKRVRASGRDAILSFCAELVQSKYAEEKTIAFDWAYRLHKQYKREDFEIFETWLKKYVSNWGSCDDFCRHAFGAFVYQFPESLPAVITWTRSESRWLRRGAAVIMIYSLRKGKHLDVALRIADALFPDDDYLVQNGYGWMLKDASIMFPEKVFEYVMRNKEIMPRRALRYAVERFTVEQRREAMV